MGKLKECPFCHSEKVKLITKENGYEHYVGCECGARGSEWDFDNSEPDFGLIAKDWNEAKRINT